MFEYKIKTSSKKSKARIGEFTTPHGVIETPVFMPVGTVGAVKTLKPGDLEELGAQIILANTYHLCLRPGENLINKAGGLHKFTRWNKPMLTDSGGFQVFSLGEGKRDKRGDGNLKKAEISEEGVTFYSHLDGSKNFISPEISIEIQEKLGADIIMAFDECPPGQAKKNDVLRATERTKRWLLRCIKAKKNNSQALFPICQGGIYRNLREDSAKFINDLNLPGNAIGGVSVGEKKKDIYLVTDWCTNILSEKKPRYLMGIGYPEDIAEVIPLGVDMFDCVLPTRLARHGTVWLKSKNSKKLKNLQYGYKSIDLKESKYKTDLTCLSDQCSCYTCKNKFSKSYLRHLIFEREPLGIHLLTIHNLKFTFDLVSNIKNQIKTGKI
ncbi:MAG: tRNA guanosine(34) transglycosylase Tgt [Kiritimatiellales bacterium]